MTKPSLREEIEKIIDRVYQDGMKDCERGMEVEGYIYDIAVASQATSAILSTIKKRVPKKMREHKDKNGVRCEPYVAGRNNAIDDFTKGLS